MTTITVKNIPEALYELLKRAAEANRRSINSEIILCIERAVRSREVNAEDILVKARRIREKTSGYLITDDEFTQAKTAGRL